MVTIGICDDEQGIREYLSALVREQPFECEIREYASTDEYLSEYLSDGTACDILLLDIEMDADGSDLNGMMLAKKIREKPDPQPILLFITGHETYVYDAFDVGAFQYLLKPINEKKFATVLGRAVDTIFSERKRQSKTLEIQFANTRKILYYEEILYIESQNHKVILHTKGGTIEYYAKIGDLERELQGDFFRIHKGYLVNLSFVDAYNKTELLLSSGETLSISKHKYADFARAHLRFMKRGNGYK